MGMLNSCLNLRKFLGLRYILGSFIKGGKQADREDTSQFEFKYGNVY